MKCEVEKRKKNNEKMEKTDKETWMMIISP
jgi:hypothetical protein